MVMKKLKISLTIATSILILSVIFLKNGNSMSVFNKQAWSESEFSALMKDRTMTATYKPDPKDVLGKVGIEIVLPDNQLSSMLVKIKSYRLYKKPQKNIYFGPYKKIIVLDADNTLLGHGKSKEDGYDLLKITFIDPVNRITYTCEQERPFLMWQLNKIVTINFLPERKADKNGEPYCYDAYIHSSLK